MKTHRFLDRWFDSLNSLTIAYILAGLYEEMMGSAEPGRDVNSFLKEAKKTWKRMPLEEKWKKYDEVEGNHWMPW